MGNYTKPFPMWLRFAMGAWLMLIAASIAHTVHTIATCDGTAVRGVFWMECVEEARRG